MPFAAVTSKLALNQALERAAPRLLPAAPPSLSLEAFGVARRLLKLRLPILALITSFAMSTVVVAAEVADAVPPDDDFAPGLLFGALFFGAVLLVLIGIGIVVGLVGVAGAVAFIALGIVSSSALIAILQRRFSAGFRALHYQLLAVIGLPGGIGGLWLGSAMFEFHLRHRSIILIGAAIGIVSGICVAFVLDRFVRFAYRRGRLDN